VKAAETTRGRSDTLNAPQGLLKKHCGLFENLSLMPTPPERWFFDLEGPEKDIWVWRRVAANGTVVRSKETFRYYLDALADAQQEGFTGAPSFGKPTTPP
jgi:hypothetical protein